MIIVGYVTEQSVGSYEIMHAYKYMLCVCTLASFPGRCLFVFI